LKKENSRTGVEKLLMSPGISSEKKKEAVSPLGIQQAFRE
jgi:hypothetical protein